MVCRKNIHTLRAAQRKKLTCRGVTQRRRSHRRLVPMVVYRASLILLAPLLMPLWSAVLTQPVTASAAKVRIKNNIFIKVNEDMPAQGIGSGELLGGSCLMSQSLLFLRANTTPIAAPNGNPRAIPKPTLCMAAPSATPKERPKATPTPTYLSFMEVFLLFIARCRLTTKAEPPPTRGVGLQPQ